MTNETIRLSVLINQETRAGLEQLACRHDTTITEIVRRAIGVCHFLDTETMKPNVRLEIASERREP